MFVLTHHAANGAEAYPDATNHKKVPENKPVLEILRELGIYKTFLEALKVEAPSSLLTCFASLLALETTPS